MVYFAAFITPAPPPDSHTPDSWMLRVHWLWRRVAATPLGRTRFAQDVPAANWAARQATGWPLATRPSPPLRCRTRQRSPRRPSLISCLSGWHITKSPCWLLSTGGMARHRTRVVPRWREFECRVFLWASKPLLRRIRVATGSAWSLRGREFEEGLLLAIADVSAIRVERFPLPPGQVRRNQLPDQPALS